MEKWNDEKRRAAEEIAERVIGLARSTILVNLRFLDAAMACVTTVRAKLDAQIMTDGERLFYDVYETLSCYKEEQNLPVRNYLHTLLHCVFRHPFVVHTVIDQHCWDLACDIAIENIINELGISAIDCSRKAGQNGVIEDLKADIGVITAEKIYRHFVDLDLPEAQIDSIRESFFADDHSIWYMSPEDRSRMISERTGADNQTRSELSDFARAESVWKGVSERMQEELVNFAKGMTGDSGCLVQNLREVNRERYDYSEFLKRFAVLHETMKVNDDEFDCVFYTYGLETYGNMPLVEPLEYKETKLVTDLVIAVDTSGSVRGEQVQLFLQKTFNIIKSEESFFRKFVIYIIQCDSEVKEAAKITSQTELDAYLSDLQLKGFGGTDFRPVFGYVNWLIEQNEFTNLKGMIYFTDGYGTFPEKMPPYQTAFVFVDDGASVIPQVPSWAISLVLPAEDL